MGNNFPSFKLWFGDAGSFTAFQCGLLQWWYHLPVWVRSPLWPGMLATLTAFGLLLAFYQVVNGAVQQSALRHKATAVYSEATWRCNTLSGLRAREGCRSQLNAGASAEALLQTQNSPGMAQSNAQAILLTSLELLSDK
ncbi:hypothetical protein [Rhodoferax ferrireducens]|uniref:hypothetical protein n=1 Tax=Rhodoferax ferrireducens TaxID=192843 RepID=UPI000E0DF2C9|nr:hypothetical protein [Rhodoferax ferrireducens]